MDFLTLSLISISVILLTILPYSISFYILKNSKFSYFKNLSIPECTLIGITIGLLLILIPSTVLSTSQNFNLKNYFEILITIGMVLPTSLFIMYVLNFKIFQNSKSVNNSKQSFNMYFSQTTKNIFKINSWWFFVAILLFFYAYLIIINPVDLSFDTANYYLPYAQGLLNVGHIPSDPFQAYVSNGGTPNMPPGISTFYAFSLQLFNGDSFKLFPFLSLLQIILAGSLLTKEITKHTDWKWTAIIFLASPPIFIYLSTTPYNTDLFFHSFFISLVYFIIKSKNSNNIIWSLLSGISLSGLILTKDIGLLFLPVIASIIFLGSKRFGNFWLFPLIILLGIPIILSMNETFFEVYREHSLSLIFLQVILVLLMHFLSKGFRFNYNLKILPFGITIIPAMIYLVWNSNVWGFPLLRTQIGSIFSNLKVDYTWASQVAISELKETAFPIHPQPALDLSLTLPLLLIGPALGGIFLIPKILACANSILTRPYPKIFLILLLIIVFNWLTFFGGFDYGDLSTFRHTLSISIMLSITSAVGFAFIANKVPLSHKKALFMLAVSIVFMIHMLTYFDFNYSTFSLKSRVIIDEKFFIPFIIYSVTIVSLFFNKYLLKIRPSILESSAFFILLISLLPFLISTQETIDDNDGSYDKTSMYNLSNIHWYKQNLAIHDFFKSNEISGKVLAYHVDSLNYRTSLEVYEMGTVLNLAILKPILVGDEVQNVISNIKNEGIEYIVVPIEGNSGERFTKLYKHTKLTEILRDEYSTPVFKAGIFTVYKLK